MSQKQDFSKVEKGLSGAELETKLQAALDVIHDREEGERRGRVVHLAGLIYGEAIQSELLGTRHLPEQRLVELATQALDRAKVFYRVVEARPENLERRIVEFCDDVTRIAEHPPVRIELPIEAYRHLVGDIGPRIQGEPDIHNRCRINFGYGSVLVERAGLCPHGIAPVACARCRAACGEGS